jgi:putative ABC transport system substrate-binding protein
MLDRRRMLLLAAGAVIAPAKPWAQPSRGILPRLGLLVSETLAGQASRIEALRAGLADLGYVEGRTVAIEIRSAESDYSRLSQLAAELVASKVDVIVAFGIKALAAARRATSTIPIVIPATSSDLVALGFARRFQGVRAAATGRGFVHDIWTKPAFRVADGENCWASCGGRAGTKP